MDETEPDDVITVGQRLREAREAKGLSVEDIAAQTRIPTRHLTSLEESNWDKLPAATYSIGFAKNYAGAVGLDRNEIGELLRAEMGGYTATPAYQEVYEAVDPARTKQYGLGSTTAKETLTLLELLHKGELVSADASCLMHVTGVAERAGRPLRALHLAQVLRDALRSVGAGANA